MSEEKKMNIYEKISAVMQDVEYLSKDDHIKFKSTNYRAISEEKVTRTVRESLIKHGLIILPIEQEHKREGTLSTVDTRYKIVDTDTGESEMLVSSGTGVDTQDKGVGKAMTYSYKYLLLRTFAIPTGEDPDKTSSAELDEQERKKQQQQEQQTDLNNEITTEFSRALQKVGGKDKLYEQLETDKEGMNKLIKSKDNKKKQAMITKLKELA